MLCTWLITCILTFIMISLPACTCRPTTLVNSRHHDNQQGSVGAVTRSCVVNESVYQRISDADDQLLQQRQALTDGSHSSSTWNKTHLTYRIINSPAHLAAVDVHEAISNALQVWSDVTPLVFTLQLNSISPVDISLQFFTRCHDDGFPFDGPGKIVAHAFLPDDVSRPGQVHFDADEQWTVTATRGTSLFMVAVHELGHVLGLKHSSVTGALMSPWHQQFNTDFILPDDDVTAIQRLYGVSTNTTRRVYTAPTATPTSINHNNISLPALTDDDVTRSRGQPELCHTDFDAISLIRSQLFAFKDHWFWLLTPSSSPAAAASSSLGQSLQQFPYGQLPVEIEKVDAVFERPTDGRIFFFSGRRYWELAVKSTETLVRRGRPLTDLSLPLTTGLWTLCSSGDIINESTSSVD